MLSLNRLDPRIGGLGGFGVWRLRGLGVSCKLGGLGWELGGLMDSEFVWGLEDW